MSQPETLQKKFVPRTSCATTAHSHVHASGLWASCRGAPFSSSRRFFKWSHCLGARGAVHGFSAWNAWAVFRADLCASFPSSRDCVTHPYFEDLPVPAQGNPQPQKAPFRQRGRHYSSVEKVSSPSNLSHIWHCFGFALTDRSCLLSRAQLPEMPTHLTPRGGAPLLTVWAHIMSFGLTTSDSRRQDRNGNFPPADPGSEQRNSRDMYHEERATPNPPSAAASARTRFLVHCIRIMRWRLTLTRLA